MFKIDQKIIDQTRGHCPQLKACLSGDMSFFCGKVKEGEGDYLVMDTSSNFHTSNCPYSYKVKGKDSDIYVCACPVRKEIYRKYGK